MARSTLHLSPPEGGAPGSSPTLPRAVIVLMAVLAVVGYLVLVRGTGPERPAPADPSPTVTTAGAAPGGPADARVPLA
jgi:hypothetical protein